VVKNQYWGICTQTLIVTKIGSSFAFIKVMKGQKSETFQLSSTTIPTSPHHNIPTSTHRHIPTSQYPHITTSHQPKTKKT
jgi:hypothetical protein